LTWEGKLSKSRQTVTILEPPSLSVDDNHLEPPLGLLYLASAARAVGHYDISFYDMSGCKDEDEAAKRIEAVPETAVYAIHILCTTHRYTCQLIDRIRKCRPDAYVIIGGPNPSAMPEDSLRQLNADVAVVGEGEDAFVRCLNAVTKGQPIQGVMSGVARGDIDSYAFPARDLVDWPTYTRRLADEPVVSLISSRGCSHRCAFCNSVVMGAGAPLVRYRSPENVASEVADLRRTFRCLRFNDDNFAGHPRLLELLERLAALDVVFRVFARIEDLTPTVCRALRAAGCVHVSVGLESLDPENLRVIGKGRQIGHEENVRAAHEAGLTVRAYFMVGLPHDSDENIELWFSRAASLGAKEFSIYPLIPYPGTRIARDPARWGYQIVDPNFTNYVQIGRGGRSSYALSHFGFGPQDVARWRKTAEDILFAAGLNHARDSRVAR
jgi:anaerobic magnesium-protoporphyrin IX monomethyl ester cyclase